MIEEVAPAQYDGVELIADVVSLGVLIPEGTRGTIVELQGEPVDAYTVEFDYNRFGDAFLPDLRTSQFKKLKIGNKMIITTTPSIEGKPIRTYHGIVVGEAIMGANVVRDVFASITDIVGGRSGAYESKLQDARDTALRELEERAVEKGANAVVGVDLDYEVVGSSMLMVSASGTAVTVLTMLYFAHISLLQTRTSVAEVVSGEHFMAILDARNTFMLPSSRHLLTRFVNANTSSGKHYYGNGQSAGYLQPTPCADPRGNRAKSDGSDLGRGCGYQSAGSQIPQVPCEEKVEAFARGTRYNQGTVDRTASWHANGPDDGRRRCVDGQCRPVSHVFRRARTDDRFATTACDPIAKRQWPTLGRFGRGRTCGVAVQSLLPYAADRLCCRILRDDVRRKPVAGSISTGLGHTLRAANRGTTCGRGRLGRDHTNQQSGRDSARSRASTNLLNLNLNSMQAVPFCGIDLRSKHSETGGRSLHRSLAFVITPRMNALTKREKHA